MSPPGPCAEDMREMQDFEAIRQLALRSGLEDGTFDHIVCAYGVFDGDRLIGCAALKATPEFFSVEWLAVDEDHRGRDIASRLIGRIQSEAKARGATTLWALARAPGFFEKIGFTICPEPERGGPTLKNCRLCPQFEKVCHPRIVARDLTDVPDI